MVTKAGYVTGRWQDKGSGSAYGGKWQPNPSKPADSRYIGEPGEIKTTYKNGYRIDTKIGDDGKATMERHYTDHNKPWAHTNPHDHIIKWDNPNEHPEPQGPQNYNGEIPELKAYQERNYMKATFDLSNTPEQDHFVSISDFKDCMRWHGEVEFTWKGIDYSVTPTIDGKISISHSRLQETERICNTADEVLDYMVGEDRLRDVITQVTVWARTI